ncbi:outer membrane beta-barrel protein [Hyphomicrobium sp. D-2]|uniref:outer membrane protein n=1 Tax=Hyphomicrobium sp. D-2 TaxID=3041621 RepID=UPI00245665BB|nr:outer membrane beta-barrel protein [Hyphomicrobium sp. D-2]MDH4982999.1 outer membrane beta-barrel protein [Hyphomicrobium sp. D-2]
MPATSPFRAIGLIACSAGALAAFSVAAMAQEPAGSAWQGAYAGLVVGGTWNSHDTTDISTTTSALNPLEPFANVFADIYASQTSGKYVSGKGTNFFAGGKLGYNWQLGGFVTGFETDLQGPGADPGRPYQSTFTPAWTYTTTTTISHSVDYLGTLRGRLGMLLSPSLLMYGTGGLAYAGTTSRVDVSQTINLSTIDNGVSSAKSTSTRVGWTLGGGIEWLLGANWSLGGDYLYYDLGKERFSAGSVAPMVLPNAAGQGAPLFVNDLTGSTRFNGQILRVGVNYHFN